MQVVLFQINIEISESPDLFLINLMKFTNQSRWFNMTDLIYTSYDTLPAQTENFFFFFQKTAKDERLLLQSEDIVAS